MLNIIRRMHLKIETKQDAVRELAWAHLIFAAYDTNYEDHTPTTITYYPHPRDLKLLSNLVGRTLTNADVGFRCGFGHYLTGYNPSYFYLRKNVLSTITYGANEPDAKRAVVKELAKYYRISAIESTILGNRSIAAPWDKDMELLSVIVGRELTQDDVKFRLGGGDYHDGFSPSCFLLKDNVVAEIV